MVFMLHVVNGVAEMFLTEKDGTASDLNRPTKIDLAQLMEAAGFDKHPSDPEQQPVDLEIGAVTAFYDPKAKRYAIVWSTSSLTPDVTPPVFMAVSQNRNPLGDWTVWAVDLRPSLAKGLDFCNNRPANDYVFEFPQVRSVCCCYICLTWRVDAMCLSFSQGTSCLCGLVPQMGSQLPAATAGSTYYAAFSGIVRNRTNCIKAGAAPDLANKVQQCTP